MWSHLKNYTKKELPLCTFPVCTTIRTFLPGTVLLCTLRAILLF